MNVSVILTVLNEGDSLHEVLDSLAVQTCPPDEVVVADGGSCDNTVAILREYAAAGRLPLKVIETPGANISQGRNAAIRAATGEVIAATDAGVRCAPDWLARLTAPLRAQPGPASVAGFFHADARSVFEMAMGATVLPEARDVNPKTFLPSSRSVAYLKSAWETAGGYPEWLDYCEDVIFDLRLRDAFGPFVFVPEAVVHFRPRGSLGAFARQYYRYARGDGKANLFWRQHAVRYLTYLAVAPLLVYAALAVSPWLWLVGGLAGLAYLRRPLCRIWPRLPALAWTDRLRALLCLPLIRVVGDVAKMLGYPAGVWWRLTRRTT
jgi:glycosyltransferase involved in cell wall biosynthesis